MINNIISPNVTFYFSWFQIKKKNTLTMSFGLIACVFMAFGNSHAGMVSKVLQSESGRALNIESNVNIGKSPVLSDVLQQVVELKETVNQMNQTVNQMSRMSYQQNSRIGRNIILSLTVNNTYILIYLSDCLMNRADEDSLFEIVRFDPRSVFECFHFIV